MRSVALFLLVACTASNDAPKDREADWKQLEQRYAPVKGEWEGVMRVMSVARRFDLEDQQKLPEAVSAMRSALLDTTPTTVIDNIAPVKDLQDLPFVASLIFARAQGADDPAVLALVKLADDMRKRGGLSRARVAVLVLKDAAMWSVEHAARPEALLAIAPVPGDFVAAVGREVVAVSQQLAEGAPAQQVKELHVFAVERMKKLEEKPDDPSHVRKNGNWRDEPDALDHPLISKVATNLSPYLDDFERLGETLVRLKLGTLKAAAKPEVPRPCEPIVLKGLTRKGTEIDVPLAEVKRAISLSHCLGDEARIVPLVKDKEIAGYTLLGIPKGRVFSQLGFENGDVVEKAAGVPLNGTDAVMTAVQGIEKSAVTEVVVRRKKAIVKLTWRAH